MRRLSCERLLEVGYDLNSRIFVRHDTAVAVVVVNVGVGLLCLTCVHSMHERNHNKQSTRAHTPRSKSETTPPPPLGAADSAKTGVTAFDPRTLLPAGV